MRRNVLLLQGPVGPFFQRFAQDLEHNGFSVFKINFNGGDKYYFKGDRAIDFRGEVSEWEEYLEGFIHNNDIGRIYLFGDCRFYHKVARSVAEANNVRVFVFEEGYIRPNFITLEETGVNGNSSIMGKKLDVEDVEPHVPENYKYPSRVFRNMVVYAICYYLASAAYSSRFSGYVHHRPLDPLSEGSKWLLSVFRKLRYSLTQSKQVKLFTGKLNNRYFLCPLQVHCDMQIRAHSEYTSIEHFIGEVVESFAKNADSEHSLVFKHHPMDRGYTDYSILIKKLAYEHKLGGRLFYVHDLDLPSMLKGARGSVLINSTVGMSSMHHGTPVKTMGRAIYDRDELTCQQDINDFWRAPGTINKAAYSSFRDYLIHKNQVNGSFYKLLDDAKNSTGLEWSREMQHAHSYMPERVDSPMPPTLQVVAGRDVKKKVVLTSNNKHGKLAS